MQWKKLKKIKTDQLLFLFILYTIYYFFYFFNTNYSAYHTSLNADTKMFDKYEFDKLHKHVVWKTEQAINANLDQNSRKYVF